MEITEAIARNRAINERISALRKKVDAANSIKSSLSAANNSITTEINTWTTKYSAFEADTMSPIVVEDKFEGVTAEKISVKLPNLISTMDSTKTLAGSVKYAIGEQLSRLDTYISNLTSEIASLRGGLIKI